TRFVKPNHPDPKVELRFNWNAAIAQDPFADCGVYFGSQFLHYSNDCGDSWKILSPDLTTNDTTKQRADRSGGLTMDATNAENHTTILAIAPSPADRQVIWVGTDDGHLQLTRDGGNSWKQCNKSLSGLPAGSWIPYILVSPVNAAEAWVVANNYRRNDEAPYVYHTTNYGNDWERIADESQVKGFALSIVQDHKQPNLLFLGTDVGLYVSFDKGKKWHHWTKGFPQVQVSDMKIHPVEDDLVIGTFGRALWILDDIHPLREIAAAGMSFFDREFDMIHSSPGYLVSYRSYDGVRFSGQGEFKGDNRAYDRIGLNIWRKPAPKDKGDQKSEDKEKSGAKPSGEEKGAKVQISIYDSSRKVVRRFKRKLEEGLNRVSWGLEAEGVRYPSRNEAKEDDDMPGGSNVLPGRYQVIAEWNGKKDSIEVEVKADPRNNSSMEDMKVVRQWQDTLMSMASSAKKSFDRLQEAKKSIALVEKLLEWQPDSVKKEFKTMHKSLQTRLDSLTHLFVEPENQKGIQRDPDQLNSVLFGAGGYVRSSWKIPGQNAMTAIEKARVFLRETTKAVDAFVQGAWKEYQVKVEKLEPIFFKNE
ncbi:MAG: YCF48-related protein, partial [Saprospiraceae bacterium]|nr:YCF48-related protein [Saprospiraceae bacterium]